MNDSLKKRSIAYEQFTVFLRESIRSGAIPKEHHDAANDIIEAERSGVLYALAALKQLPKEEPLRAVYSLLATHSTFAPLLVSNTPNPKMTFDNFVGSDTNRLAQKLTNSLIQGSSHFNMLFISGNNGQGKTHLLCAVANALGPRSLYVNMADLGMEHERAAQTGLLPELHHWLYQFSTILLDDFESISGREKLQDAIEVILKGALIRNIPVVISSTRKLAKLPGISTSLASVISHGVTTELNLPESEKMKVIAQNAAGDVALSPEILDYLIENITDNVHHLVGAVRQIITLSQQTDTPISIDLARAVAPMEADLQSSSIPNFGPALDSVFSGALGEESNRDTNSEEKQQKAKMFKEMLASAQNEEEQCLALQIALSERIKDLRAVGETAEIARLKTALGHLRSGKIQEALDSTVL